MLWVFLIFAFLLIYLAVTSQLESVDARLSKYVAKIKAAYQYMRADINDVETELESEMASAVEEELKQDIVRQHNNGFKPDETTVVGGEKASSDHSSATSQTVSH